MRSTGYTFAFAAAVCIACSLVVSSAATLLRDRQAANVRMDIQKNILSSVGLLDGVEITADNVERLYGSRIEAKRIDSKGMIVEGGEGLPLYLRKDGETVEAYAIPISGKGLWSTIYGYMALEPDGATVKGVTFYKHGETPGLGGEIEKAWFLDNFPGKKIVDGKGKLASISIAKGKAAENAPAGMLDHYVDGVSGATLTGKGVTAFIRADLERYDAFFSKVRSKS